MKVSAGAFEPGASAEHLLSQAFGIQASTGALCSTPGDLGMSSSGLRRR